MSFQQAVQQANAQRGRKSVSNEILLQLYGAYKVATVGPNNTPQPSAIDMKGRAKWQAWKQASTLTSAQAQQRYIQLVNQYLR